MRQAADDLLHRYETGRVSRRDPVVILTTLAAARSLPAVAEPAGA